MESVLEKEKESGKKEHLTSIGAVVRLGRGEPVEGYWPLVPAGRAATPVEIHHRR